MDSRQRERLRSVKIQSDKLEKNMEHLNKSINDLSTKMEYMKGQLNIVITFLEISRVEQNKLITDSI
jgi:uncharacterized coiled-coil protein SlyX